MKLQTNLAVGRTSHPLDYGSQLLLLGSCFAETMGGKLAYFKFRSCGNPLGILFNPLPIETCVRRAVDNRPYNESDVFLHNGRWHCFETHSALSGPSASETVANLNKGLSDLRKMLLKASHVFITPGTAWIYRHLKGNTLVANCHKVPQKEFSRELSPVPDLEKSIRNITDLVFSVNRNARIIFTISPVRHLKEGFVDNQRSKAHLITALHRVLSDAYGEGRMEYFPAYEIMMDELRDYRFYARDMVHPNELGLEYIWEKFREAWISGECRAIMETVNEIRKGRAHRAFAPDTPQHKEFRKALADKITTLQKKYPFIAFNE